MKKKIGMALTVELVIVISIIITLLSLGTSLTTHLIQTNKITNIVYEYSKFSKAIKQFQQNYIYYPGDISNEIFSGKLYSQDLSDIYSAVIDSSDNFHRPRTSSVGVAKSTLAFPQMHQVGLIDFTYNSSIVTSTCDPISTLKGNVFPKAKFSPYGMWFFWLDTNDGNQIIQNSKIYDAANYQDYKNIPRLTLLNPINVSTCTFDVDGSIGLVSGKIAKMLSQKFDEDPNAVNSRFIADQHTTTGECIQTNGEFDSQSASEVSSKACAITFKLK